METIQRTPLRNRIQAGEVVLQEKDEEYDDVTAMYVESFTEDPTQRWICIEFTCKGQKCAVTCTTEALDNAQTVVKGGTTADRFNVKQ